MGQGPTSAYYALTPRSPSPEEILAAQAAKAAEERERKIWLWAGALIALVMVYGAVKLVEAATAPDPARDAAIEASRSLNANAAITRICPDGTRIWRASNGTLFLHYNLGPPWDVPVYGSADQICGPERR